jgi:hypothetical protein
MDKLHDKPEVKEKDRVRTKTNRLGVVRRITGEDTAHVDWDDGDSFPIRTAHLEVLARDWDVPPQTKAS